MKKFFGSKLAILILGGISILVIIYLIASLGGLDLKPAKPFAYVQESLAIAPGGPPAWNYFLWLVIVIFCVFVIILYILLPSALRKKFLQAMIWLVLAGIVIFLILGQIGLGKPMALPQETPGEVFITPVSEPTDTPEPEVIPSVFTPPQVSSWTSYLVALILLVVAGVWGWLVWRKRKTGAPYDALAEIARSALDDIEAGKDWGDTILNSYYRMNKSVADWRGIHRQAGATPAEFADYLVSTHLPRAAVYRLTALFERVRYGDKKSTRKDIREAVDCLTAILDYCRGAK